MTPPVNRNNNNNHPRATVAGSVRRGITTTTAQDEPPQQQTPTKLSHIPFLLDNIIPGCSPIRQKEQDDDNDNRSRSSSCSKASASISVDDFASVDDHPTNSSATTALSSTTKSALPWFRNLFCFSSATTTTTCTSPDNNNNKQQERPMPDMDAFDPDDDHDDGDDDDDDDGVIKTLLVATRTSSVLLSHHHQHHRDVDDYHHGIHTAVNGTVTTPTTTSPTCTIPKPMACPPTPMPTPSWVQEEASLLGRRNSSIRGDNDLLSATKVLATCSPKTMDRRTLLENSILEDDDDDDDECSHGSSIHRELQQQQKDEQQQHNDTTTPEQQETGQAGCWSSPLSSHDTATASDTPHCLVDLKLNNARRRYSHSSSNHGQQSVVTIDPVQSMLTSFDILSDLGKGKFAEVYKVRSKTNGKLYAVKKILQMFSNKKDRERRLAEFRFMQQLQRECSDNNSNSLYLVFLYQVWQQDGHLYGQMELCCRHSCRELMDSLRPRNWCKARVQYPSLRRLVVAAASVGSNQVDEDASGRLMPEATIWKIGHDVCAGLSHMHSHGLVHHDIKPSNVFFVSHSRFGAMCKIGDFGMAGEIGTPLADGQEGDSKYLAPELLSSKSSAVKQPCADIFSLGLLLYEMTSDLTFEVPSDGPRWHELRSGGPKLFDHHHHIPPSRDVSLIALVRSMIHPIPNERPTVDQILQQHTMVKQAGMECHEFLRDYIHDVEQEESFEPTSIPHQQLQPLHSSPRPIPAVPPSTPVPTKRCGASPVRLAFSPPQMLYSSPETATRS